MQKYIKYAIILYIVKISNYANGKQMKSNVFLKRKNHISEAEGNRSKLIGKIMSRTQIRLTLLTIIQ